MPTRETIEVQISSLVVDPELQVRTDGIDTGHVFALSEVLDKLPRSRLSAERGR